MHILVTGGAGFIGSHVVDQLIDAGHSVAVVDNLSTGVRDYVNPKASFHELSIGDSGIAEVFQKEKPDAVCHLAAQINVTESVKDPAFDAMTNIIGTINLLEASVRAGVKRFVFSSTGGAIYGSPEKLPADENTKPEPMSPYGTSKLATEEYIKTYSRNHPLTYVILRYSNVFGPRQVPHGECGVCAVLTELMLKGKQPTLYGFGEPVRDYVYVGDVARANVLALDRGRNVTVNISNGRGTTVNEIFDALDKVIGFHQAPLRKPLRAGEVEKIICDNGRAKAELGWEPTVGLLEGLQNTIDHMRG
ncbi:MAG: NAD-dependent epimerase/dehydratase family protein [Candidatus Hydrogenedentes bacterium]|nr:NAD-dependent epimerase/dehydratase family protein [Candidatus Hydrogenedentota bacterium]